MLLVLGSSIAETNIYIYIEKQIYIYIYIYIYIERERERGRAKSFFLESFTKSWDTIEETKAKIMLIFVIKWLVADDTTDQGQTNK